MSEAFLLVAAGGRRVGLPVTQLEAVMDSTGVLRVPAAEPALAGVAAVRGATLPVMNLSALLGVAGEGPAEVFVLVEVGGARLCLAVEGAETLLRGEPMPLPPDSTLSWARAVLRDGDALVPLLDLEALAERLADTGRAT
ncbi:MAG TPA: chemotaxis protein CheW [Gemmatimonadales bacterium]|nr:chemotaxis protein CheW [Gemmatimonadales bacterium]